MSKWAIIPTGITRVLTRKKKGGGKIGKSESGKRMREAEVGEMWGHKLRKATGLQKLQRDRFFLEASGTSRNKSLPGHFRL